MSAISLACHDGNSSSPLPNLDQSQIRKEESAREPTNDYVNKEGWQIPSSRSTTITEKKEFSAKTVSGYPVKVNSVTFGLSQPILSQDTVKAVNRNKEESVRIWSFTELKANDKVFCYQLRAQPLSPKTNEGLGINFYYRICDLDGDSKFETLSFEKDIKTIPDWVIK